jgi:hypothetical protein
MTNLSDHIEYQQITKARYRELLAAEAKLNALECAGVDDWDGYSIAMTPLLGDAGVGNWDGYSIAMTPLLGDEEDD